MTYSFESLPQLVNLRGKLPHDGWYRVLSEHYKTDIAVHHSLTKTGNSRAFAKYHVGTNGWPEVAYHFVILTDGTIEYNHQLGVLSYHVGNSNKQAVGVCLVGDFRSGEPTKEQRKSFRELHACLVKDMPNYKRTRGHNEFPGYAWKACPEFDYKAVLERKYDEVKTQSSPTKAAKLQPTDDGLYRLATGAFSGAESLAKAHDQLAAEYGWMIYERADDANFNPAFRLFTGTFTGRNVAEHYAEELRKKFGWTIYIKEA